MQAAHRFQVSAELRDIELLDCSASTSEGKAPVSGQLRLGMEMDPCILKVSAGEAKFAVRISVCGDSKDAEEEPDQHLFKVVCRYALTYKLKPAYVPLQLELDAFRDGSAIFHCWPYTRELVQNLTMRMGLQIPPLPLLRIGPKPQPKKVTLNRPAKSDPGSKTEKIVASSRPVALGPDAVPQT